MIKTAMILASGLGTRMRPITNTIPKPMVKVNGRALISRIIDDLIEYGIEKIIVNLHYKAEILSKYLKEKYQFCLDKFIFIHEEKLLGTGGSIVNALDFINDKPFFVINSDVLIPSIKPLIYDLMAKNFAAEKMRALLLLHPLKTAIGYDGVGDFSINPDGLLSNIKADDKKFVFAGIHITKASNFQQEPIKEVSWVEIYKKFLINDIFESIYATENPYPWLHVGTASSIDEAEKYLLSNKFL